MFQQVGAYGSLRATEKARQKMKILAVDDDEIILELLKETMACSGFDDVTTAISGQDALREISYAETPFDCFLLDIQMPMMDGVELCTKIRGMHAYRKSPVVMITAMSDKQYIDRAFAAGASDYVTKPFDVLELGTRVKIAAKAVAEIKQAQQAEFENVTLKERLEARTRHEISDPLRIEGVDGFLDYAAFENYLLLQSRQGHFTSGMMAFQVKNIREIYRMTPAEDFYYFLADIGEAISDTLRGSFDFLSYRGNGIFVCAYNRANPPANDELNSEIDMAVANLELVYENGDPMHVEMKVGEQVSAGIFSAPGSLRVLLRAIDNLSEAEQPSDALDATKLARFGRKNIKRKPKLFERFSRVS